MKSPKHTRNPYYNDIRKHQVIPTKQNEVDVDDWDEDLLDMLNNKYQKEQRVNNSTKARQKRKEARHAKEDRIYGE